MTRRKFFGSTAAALPAVTLVGQSPGRSAEFRAAAERFLALRELVIAHNAIEARAYMNGGVGPLVDDDLLMETAEAYNAAEALVIRLVVGFNGPVDLDATYRPRAVRCGRYLYAAVFDDPDNAYSLDDKDRYNIRLHLGLIDLADVHDAGGAR